MVTVTTEKNQSSASGSTKQGPPEDLVILDEKYFLGNGPANAHTSSSMEGGSYSIRLDRDSYVWLFSGRRGAGKSVAMTFFIVFAVILYNMRIISNYAIEFLIRRYRPDGKTYLQHVKNETIDFEKLLTNPDKTKLFDSVPPEVKIISSGAALILFAIIDLEFSIACEDFTPCLCIEDALP